MSRMVKMFPKEYAFYPKAWCLPAEYVGERILIRCDWTILFEYSYSDFAKYCSEKKYKAYISKPDVGCQGRGIFITKNPSKDIKP
jgi:tubulin polyglutamylase TTLL6/13